MIVRPANENFENRLYRFDQRNFLKKKRQTVSIDAHLKKRREEKRKEKSSIRSHDSFRYHVVRIYTMDKAGGTILVSTTSTMDISTNWKAISM